MPSRGRTPAGAAPPSLEKLDEVIGATCYCYLLTKSKAHRREPPR